MLVLARSGRDADSTARPVRDQGPVDVRCGGAAGHAGRPSAAARGRRAVLRHRPFRSRHCDRSVVERASSTVPGPTNTRCTRSSTKRRAQARRTPATACSLPSRTTVASRHSPRTPVSTTARRTMTSPTRGRTKRRGIKASVAWSARCTTPTSRSSPARRGPLRADHSPRKSGERRSWNAASPSRRSSLSHARLNAAATSRS